MTTTNGNLLDGVRILDLTRVMSGPYCTAMLADLGAEIIKVEMPGFGEEGRHFAPHVKGESAYFSLLNRGKKSIAVDLKSDEGKDLVRKIAQTSDVVVENFRPGVAKRLGLDAETLQADNSSLIYASISGFGQEGPYANWPAFDLVIQAMSGMMSVTGEKDGRPMAVGESVADVATGMFASWGIMAALFEREKTGKGRRLEVAMLDAVFSMLLTGLSRQLYTSEDARRVGNRHPETYPVDSFSAQDGDFVLVGFSDHAFASIATAIDQPELVNDPRFVTNPDRNKNEAVLRSIIAEWAASQTCASAVDTLQKAGVPSGPVWSLKDLVTSSHASERGLVSKGVNTALGDVSLVNQPVRFEGAKRPSGQQSPLLGEHTDIVLSQVLNLAPNEIEALRNKGVVA